MASSSGSLPSAPSAAAVAEEEEEMIPPLQPRAPRRTVRNRLKNFRANRAAKANANKKKEIRRLKLLLEGNRLLPISRMNRFRIARSGNSELKTALVEFNKKMANAASAAAAPKKAANKAAMEKEAANKAAAELNRLRQLVTGNGSRPIPRINRFRIARHSNQELKTALVEFNKRAAQKAATAAAAKAAVNKNANASEKKRLLKILTNNQPLSYANRARIMSRRKNANLQNALRKYNASKKAAKELAAREKAAAKGMAELNKLPKGAPNDTLLAIKNYRNRLARGLEFKAENAKGLLEKYNAAHKGRPGLLNDANVRAIRKQLANLNKNEKRAAAEDVTRATINKLIQMNNNNPGFLVGYKQLGMFGRRKLAPPNKEQLNAKYSRIMKTKANKAKANKAAANKAKANKAAANKAASNKAAANKAAQRKFQINSLLNEILTHNQATIKSRIASNLNNPKNFKGWRKVANKEKLRLLEAKLKPVPTFNEAAARNALKNYLNATVKPTYNKALVNAILRLPNLNNNTRRRLQAPRMYALQRGAGAFRNRAVTTSGAFGNKARSFFTRSAAPAAVAPAAVAPAAVAPAAVALGRGALGRGAGGFFSRLFAPKPPPTFIPFKKGTKIPFGYVLKTNNKGLGYYKNNNALTSQLEHRGYGPAPKPVSTTTGVSVGVGPEPRNRNRYGYGYGYGNRNRGGGGGGPSIVFSPKINVGAARIGAQTFGGTRVGGQTMGGSHVRTGNTGSTTLKTGSTQVSNVGKVSNTGRLTVSAPTTNGSRHVAATSEQLIRSAGGAEAVEQGIEALRKANGNVTRAKAASRLPNNTFTNIYAMGGPNAAKRIVEQRRRRRTGTGARGGPTKKKRVAHKPRKQYIKLTPYQFRRLTDHIKKNNLRKVLIKEITH